MKYWVEKYANIPPVLELPTDTQRPSHRNHEGSTVSIRMEAPAYEPVKEVAKELNTTMFVLLLTAYEVLLSRLSGQEDIVVQRIRIKRSRIRIVSVSPLHHKLTGRG